MKDSDKLRPYMISVDWYQIYLHRSMFTPILDTYLQGKSKNPQGYVSQYRVRPSKEYSPSYRESVELYLHSQRICTVCWNPRNSCQNIMGASIKMHNALLYTSSWTFYLKDVIDALGWEYKNVTRCDLCYDCNEFYNGLNPQKFMHDYLRTRDTSCDGGSSIQSIINNTSYIRAHSDKFCVYGKHRMNDVDVESIRWGSRESAYSVYLYNKTRELAEKKYKPWIVDAWRAQGLDEDNVYRLEISISCKGTRLKEIDGDALFRLSHDMLGTQQAIEKAFVTYAQRKACFHINNGQKYVKDMPILQMFSCTEEVTLKPSNACKKKDSGRSERICVNVLKKVSEEYADIDTNDRIHLKKSAELITRICDAKQKRWRDDRYVDMLIQQFSAEKRIHAALDYRRQTSIMTHNPATVMRELLYSLANRQNYVSVQGRQLFTQAGRQKNIEVQNNYLRSRNLLCF